MFPARYNPGVVTEISVGGVVSKMKSDHVMIKLLPARSVAVSLILPMVLSVFGNAKVYVPLLLVPVVMIILLAKLVVEYSSLIDVGQKFASVPVPHVIVYRFPST